MTSYVRRRTLDRAARVGITLGGIVIIASILAMLASLVTETLPLWKKARVLPPEVRGVTSGPLPIVAANAYREVLFGVTKAGRAVAVEFDSIASPIDSTLHGSGIRLARPVSPTASRWVAATEDGQLLSISFDDGVEFVREGRRYTPAIHVSPPIPLRPGHAVAALGAAGDEESFVAVAAFQDGDVRVHRRRERTTLFGDVKVDSLTWRLTSTPGTSAAAVDRAGGRLYLGTREGRIVVWPLDPGGTEPLETVVASDTPITAMATLLGGTSLVIGTRGGDVTVWFPALDPDTGVRRLFHAHTFRAHGTAVAGIAASARDKGFVTWDAAGELFVHFSTTAETRASAMLPGQPPWTVVMTPKADGLLLGDGLGALATAALENPHPEVTFGSLFTPVHYEGYPDPDYAWQSTGSTDETEPKLSLVPLIFGTMKGTFYALFVSVPIAILAALYTALFMRPEVRSFVKPAMELMAAMPSVVLGLLAGLWLAPRLQGAMPVFLVIPAVGFLAILFFGLSWRRLPEVVTRRVRPGGEAFLLIPVLFAVVGALVSLNGVVDGWFDGGFLDWLYHSFDVRYDQRNALIVGLAMGLAVIPIIFSISEDALSSVPRHLTAGSLALGATPWQTAWRVVLPAASPGIFSAVMIGFGRAVGETMIVLMATGNTPIMDWNPFNGFRTLSANIAVEIPEAPHGESLYRLLFLAALLLFAITFVVNTAAEIVRQRLRSRYSRF